MYLVAFNLYFSGLLVEVSQQLMQDLELTHLHSPGWCGESNYQPSKSFVYHAFFKNVKKILCLFSIFFLTDSPFFFSQIELETDSLQIFCVLIVLLRSWMGRWDFQLLWMLGSPGSPPALPAVPDKWACAVVGRCGGLMGLQKLGQRGHRCLK